MSAIVQIQQLFDTLDKMDQFYIIERLVRRMRRAETKVEEMELETEWNPLYNAPYPIPEGVYTEDQLKPRGQQGSASNE